MSLYSKNTVGRVGFLDEARGLSVVLMVLYHLLYDLTYLFPVISTSFFHSPVMSAIQLYIVGSFILISGISSRYSKSNAKRGLMVLGIGVAMTAFTFFFMRNQVIYFGVLHFLGCAMILFGLLEDFLNKLPCFWGLCFMLLLFAVTWGIPSGHIGFFNLLEFPLPRLLYNMQIFFPMGFPGSGFYSADYVPLIPWLFLFLAGSYLGEFFTQSYMPSTLYRTHCTPLAAVGRKALLVYILHQPLLYGVLSILFTALAAMGLYVS